MEVTTYHPVKMTLPGKLKHAGVQPENPLFGMANYTPPAGVPDIEPVKHPEGPGRPAQPRNAGTMPRGTAGMQLASMKPKDHKL